jgi:hypothetical protein
LQLHAPIPAVVLDPAISHLTLQIATSSRQVTGVLSLGMAENSSNNGSNNKIMGMIKYGVERPLIDFIGNSKLSYLLYLERKRCPEIVPEKTVIKFLTHDRNTHLIVLKTDKDVKNIYDMHQVFGHFFPNSKPKL